MITLADYVGVHAASPDWTDVRQATARALLARVNALLADLADAGIIPRTNPKTGTLISGETFGGFRPQSCPIGAPLSSHKEGAGVDLFDPFGALAGYLFGRMELLVKHGLYMEAPQATPSWCHLQLRAPKSGKRVFFP